MAEGKIERKRSDKKRGGRGEQLYIIRGRQWQRMFLSHMDLSDLTLLLLLSFMLEPSQKTALCRNSFPQPLIWG